MSTSPTSNIFPRLDARTRGWLRFIWDKATTADDWSSSGTPHEWWDTRSTPPMCSLGRFDLHETGYALPVMCDITPAWREGYVRIADELVGRYTTFWAAVDWLTMIGHDPGADRYPPMWLGYIPEYLRGRYDAPGWTANGIAPWGLQPDPLGSDGNSFFRGFFNLLLCFYSYVCDDGKWASLFRVTGYRDQLFQWDHHSLVNFMVDQWEERPAGVHCENTKIWPFCVTGAGVGLQLYDGLHNRDTHHVFDNWVEYARKHYMKTNRRGELEWFTFYYDPLEKANYVLRDDISAYASLAVTLYMLPQNRELGEFLYTSSVRTLGWDDPNKRIQQLHPDPRWLLLALVVAREAGDHETENRLREFAEEHFEPRFFGDGNDRFGWFFGNGERWPRGQLSSLTMLSEIGKPGAWSQVFLKPNRRKFVEPTVTGIDYPQLGVAQAWNDLNGGALWVETYAATSAAHGVPTTWSVTKLPNPQQVTISCDGSDFTNWQVSGSDSIEIRSDIADHAFRIGTGYHGDAQDDTAAILTPSSGSSHATKSTYSPTAGCGSSCC